MTNGPYDITLPARFSFSMRATARAYLAAANAGDDEQEAFAEALKAHPLATGDEATLIAHLRAAGAMI